MSLQNRGVGKRKHAAEGVALDGIFLESCGSDEGTGMDEKGEGVYSVISSSGRSVR